MFETSNSPELMSRSMGSSPQGSWLAAPLPAQHGASKVFLKTPLPRGGGRVFWPELGIPHITFVHIPLTVAQSGHGFHLQRNLGTWGHWVPRKGSTGMLVNIIARGVPFWSPDIQLPLSSHREYTPLPTTETWNVAFFSFIQLKALNG